MAGSGVGQSKAAAAIAQIGLVLGLVLGTAGAAQATGFGVYGEATTGSSSIDSNGVHPGAKFDCVSGGAWCGGGDRTSSTGYSTSHVNTAQGTISGSVSATNVEPPGRVRSSATSDGSWWDGFVVDGTGLPSNTIVDLKLTVNLSVSDFLAAAGTPVPYARVQASINLGGPDAPSSASTVLYDNGDSTGVGFLQVAVDTPFELWGRFFTTTGVNETPVLDLGTASGSANYFVDVVGVEGLSFSAQRFSAVSASSFLPKVTTLSGHDYSSVPPDTGGGVPEPATWTLMVLGAGAVGAAFRRRASQLEPALGTP